FHATGAGGFEGPPWRVEPNIVAGNHLPGHVHVIILNENEVALQVAVLAEVNNMLDVAFAIVIARVGFPGEHELNGPRLVTGEAHDVVQLLKNERGAFISGEPPRKADRERVRIQ